MLRTYLLSRTEITSIIKGCPKTKNGFYWCPRFLELVFLNGPVIEDDYFYDRELFINKLYFSNEDLKAFNSKKGLNFDIQFMKLKSNRFYEINGNLRTLQIKDKIYKELYTLEDVIDCFEMRYDQN